MQKISAGKFHTVPLSNAGHAAVHSALMPAAWMIDQRFCCRAADPFTKVNKLLHRRAWHDTSERLHATTLAQKRPQVIGLGAATVQDWPTTQKAKSSIATMSRSPFGPAL